MNKQNISIKAKQLEHFENMFLTYFRPLSAYSFQIVRDTYVAEDIVQEVFYSIWKEWNRIDLSKSVQALLYAHTKNRSIDYLRKSSTIKETSVTEMLDESTLTGFVLRMYEQEDNLHFKNLQTAINVSVDNLPPQCKNIFNLSREQGLKNKEVAEKLGITVKAVEHQITKALSNIREDLKRKGFLTIVLLFLGWL